MSTIATLRSQARNRVKDQTTNVMADADFDQEFTNAIEDWREYVGKPGIQVDSSKTTTLNTRTIDLSSFSSEVFELVRVEYVNSATDIWELTGWWYDIANKTLYFPYFFPSTGITLNIYFVSKHDIPANNATTLTIEPEDESNLVSYACSKYFMYKAALPSYSESRPHLIAMSQEWMKDYLGDRTKKSSSFITARS